MSGHRQAALALYGVSTGDQEAILAELPAHDQEVLRAYLAELAELGFDGGAVPALVSTTAPDRAPASAAERLRGADAHALFEAVGNEPASLIAALLAIEAWPWAADLLDLLAAPQRALVRGAIDRSGAVAPERSAFLLEAVAAALARTRTRSVAPALVRSPLSALIARVSAWVK
ncbi:hypothetical protein CR152_07220 [Massilia violaceinigra]|uniref:Uncharacterized protein n=1 Tax=Massilia violaceinigra TaxID=2045208 RepID=A0A2D2DH74_9BURK|nr:hypothetical protein [Massilia violaceinigra]ATQ74321.1 hypothetical protein CR152_07220 [Massilia violaceinigra]